HSPPPCSPILPPTQRHTLSLHDALPIYLYADVGRPVLSGLRLDPDELKDLRVGPVHLSHPRRPAVATGHDRHRDLVAGGNRRSRSEEHTSELQSREKLVCRLLLEKKKTS